jgi:hypothetical protein
MKESKIEIKLDGMVINIPYDKPDRNGNVYPKSVMETAVERYNQRLLLEERRKKINKICQKSCKTN